MKKSKIIIPCCMIGFIAIIQIIVRVTKDTMIQQKGIVFYNSSVKFVNLLSLLLFLFSICLIIVPIVQKRKEKEEQILKQVEQEKKQSKQSLSHTFIVHY